MRTRPTNDEIESATDNFPEAWEVADWEEKNGAYSEARLTVELEYIPPADRLDHPQGVIKKTIDKFDHGDGASIDDVIEEAAAELDTDTETIREHVEELRTKGEVYEPRQNWLHTT